MISFDVKPVVTFETLFILIWINDNAVTQSAFEFAVMKYLSAISNIWLVLSNCSSICKWYAVDINRLMPKRLKIFVQNFEINFGFLFEIMFSDSFQFEINNRSNSAFVHSEALYVIFSKIMLTRFEALSVIVNIESNFFDSVTMKFMAIVLKEIVEAAININSLYVAWRFVWLSSQAGQCLIYWQIFRDIRNI